MFNKVRWVTSKHLLQCYKKKVTKMLCFCAQVNEMTSQWRPSASMMSCVSQTLLLQRPNYKNYFHCVSGLKWQKTWHVPVWAAGPWAHGRCSRDSSWTGWWRLLTQRDPWESDAVSTPETGALLHHTHTNTESAKYLQSLFCCFLTVYQLIVMSKLWHKYVKLYFSFVTFNKLNVQSVMKIIISCNSNTNKPSTISTILRYFYFSWAFSGYDTLCFYSTAFVISAVVNLQKKIIQLQYNNK